MILASGKMFIDLKEHLEKSDESTLIVAVERLYPFPEIQEVLESLPNLEEVSWVQEEPKTKVHGYSFILILEHLLLIDMTLAIMVEYRGQHLLKVMEKFINLFKNRIIESSINN